MKIINTKLHGIFDYTIANTLVIPWIANYYTHSDDTWILAAIGGLIGLYSLVTDYEFGLLKLLSMRMHFAFDIAIGILLVISPLLLKLDHYYFYWPLSIGV